MRFQICPQMAYTRRGIVTLVAFVWLFSTVRFQMCPQIACRGRCIVTSVAFVWFFSTVRFQMCPQMTCTRRGIFTLVAFVWFNDIASCYLLDFYIHTLQNKVIIFHFFDCSCVLCFVQVVASNWVKFVNDFLSLSVKFSMAYFHFLYFFLGKIKHYWHIPLLKWEGVCVAKLTM